MRPILAARPPLRHASVTCHLLWNAPNARPRPPLPGRDTRRRPRRLDRMPSIAQSARVCLRRGAGINQASMKRPTPTGRTGGYRATAFDAGRGMASAVDGLRDLGPYCGGNPSAATIRLERPTLAPVRRAGPYHRSRSRSPITRSRRARKHKQPHHDVPFHHIVRRRAFHRHAPLAPSRQRCHAALLQHQRLHQLPRDRHQGRPGPLSRLRARAPNALTAAGGAARLSLRAARSRRAQSARTRRAFRPC